MKKFYIFNLLILILFLRSYITNDNMSQNNNFNLFINDSPLIVKKLLPNHHNFSRNILKDDVILYNRRKDTYLITNDSVKEIKALFSKVFSLEDKKLYGQKYIGYEGSESWLNPLLEYDIETNKEVEVFKENENFRHAHILSVKNKRVLLNSYNSKDERFTYGKGTIFEYSIENKTSKEIDFEFRREYPKSSIYAADFCGDGYIVSFGFVNSGEEYSYGTRCILTDLKGKTIKYIPLTKIDSRLEITRHLKSSDDGSKITFSVGKTGDNVFMYDLKEEKLKLICEFYVCESMWSKNNESVYYITVENDNENNSYYFYRYN